MQSMLEDTGQSLHVRGLPFGLHGGHCYSVLRTLEHEGNRLVCIRNPWGSGTGEFGFTSCQQVSGLALGVTKTRRTGPTAARSVTVVLLPPAALLQV